MNAYLNPRQNDVSQPFQNAASNLHRREGWLAALNLRLVKRDAKTILAENYHEGPLRVQRPFYPEADSVCHVYLLHPPGGLVGGDELDIRIQFEEGAWGLITTPGATKIYRSNGHLAKQHIQIRIASRAIVEWLPQESILFDGSNYDARVRVDADSDSVFIGGDITCLGRPESQDFLHRCNIRNRFELWRNNVPLLLERARYVTNHPVLTADWGLRNYPIVGLLACTESDASLVNAVRANVTSSAEALFAVTELQGVLVCRYLGDSAEEAKHVLRNAWRVLRPLVLGVRGITPRIWNT